MFMSVAKCLRTLASIALVLLVCIGLLFVVGDKLVHDEGSSVAGEFDELDEILKTEVDRITAESKGQVRAVNVSSAPPIELVRAQPEFEGSQGKPLDPRYTYTQHFGEMHVAPIPQTAHRELRTDDEPDWLDHPNPLAELRRLARNANRDWTFGWILMASDANLSSLHEQLGRFDAEILGTSGRMIRVRLPTQRGYLESITALPQVQRIGFTPQETKIAGLAEDRHRNPLEASPLFVTLMDDDADGRWRSEMTQLGAVVGSYYPDLRAYKVNATQRVVDALAATDFVMAIEPIRVVKAAHNTAAPAMGVSVLRQFDPSLRSFVGSTGASVPVGIVDSGLNINHLDIASNRLSICGANFALQSMAAGTARQFNADDDLWFDLHGHGTHVAGTVFGNGAQSATFAGMAPGVQHIRIAKVADSEGAGSSIQTLEGIRFFARETGCGEAEASDRVLPLIVNMSLSATHYSHQGRDFSARALDSTVWSTGQLYVVSQGNDDEEAFSNYSAAKNSLAGGATSDSGKIAPFSSHGPTADGRLSPSVVAVGERVHSPAGSGQRGGYRMLRGTSMAAPMVTGIAALLMDVVSDYKGQPALTRAQLMATAIRPDRWLTENSGFSSTNTHGPGKIQHEYGLGKASARTAILNLDESPGWFSGSASAILEDSEYAYFDIEVPNDASGLDVVLTWDEPPGDALVGTVLNDLDLWLDLNGDCETIACGEHASRSKHDNIEWIFLRNPEPGTHRIKVLANAVYTASPRVGVAWKVIRGAATPTVTIAADQQRIEGNGEHELMLTLSADAFVAAGVKLHVDCRSTKSATCSDVVSIENVVAMEADGRRSSLRDESQLVLPPEYELEPANDVKIPMGSSLPLGEIAVGDERRVAIQVSIASVVDDPNLHLVFKTSAWNGNGAATSVDVGREGDSNLDRPANDNFTAATTIQGVSGTVPLDLLLATPEAGEPDVDPDFERVAASVWFTWEAPDTDQFRFHIPPVLAGATIPRRDYVHVFQGQSLSSLVPIVSGHWRAAFRAEEGDIYHVRIAGLSRGIPMNLAWDLSSRPENDDFINALSLGADQAHVSGTTIGATLETGEFFGVPAASTWYRWTAPNDGRWIFEAPGQRVLAFSGESVPTLRLISDTPAAHADFPTREGEEYFVMVGDVADSQEGNEYELQWFPARHSGNDSFSEAEVVTDLESQRFRVDIDYYATVEPDEPLVTGVRTEWWVWDAPEDGRYTWRLGNPDEASPTFQTLVVTVFIGSEITDLALIAKIGPGAPYAIAFDATEGERFWIAVGMPTNHSLAYQPWQPSGELAWQKSPSNDLAGNAMTLAGGSGSIAGNNAFATNELGEGSLGVGRGTLWWQFTAPTTGWFRFKVEGEDGPWSLSVVDESFTGLGSAALVATNRWQRSSDEVLLNAKEGISYQIVLGSVGAGNGGEFTLAWNEADDPGWIRYVAQLTDGHRDSEGNDVVIRRPADLAINDDGTSVFLASNLGLSVFTRDTESGKLVLRQVLDTEIDLTRASLIWDSERDRLLADECGDWLSFTATEENAEQFESREFEVQDDSGRCASFLLLDSAGANLYRFAETHVQQFALTESGAMSFMNEVSLPQRIRGAVLAPNDLHMYVVTDRLLMLEINTESGLLELTEFEDTLNLERSIGNRVLPIAVTDEGAHLFVFDQLGQNAHVYSLRDSRDPVKIWSLDPFWAVVDGSHAHRCGFADVYGRAPHVEVFCPSLVFAARWNPLEAELTGIDYVTHTQGDRFNGFPLPNYDIPSGVAVSPDKKHVYLATPYAGILVFERSSPATQVLDMVSEVTRSSASPNG